jgi:type II secretory pathway component PulJ
MKRLQRYNPNLSGTTLLELVVATTIMSLLMTSTVVSMRSAHATWQAHRDDTERAESAHALLRHLVRHIRQAVDISSMTGPADNSGELSLVMPSGETLTYETNGSDVLLHKTGNSDSSLLADNLTGVTFVGYQADSTTPTTDLAQVQLVECIVSYVTPLGTPRTLSIFAFKRSW